MKHRWLWALAWAALLMTVAMCVTSGNVRVSAEPPRALAAQADVIVTATPAADPTALPAADPYHGSAAAATAPPSTPEPTPESTPESTPEPTPEPPAFAVTVESVREEGLSYHVALITLTDPSQLRAAFAGGAYSGSARQYASRIAEAQGALVALNGDYFGFRENGVVIRDGVLLRNKPSSKDALIVDAAGDFTIAKERELDTDALLEAGVRHVFSFGPALMQGGAVLPMPEKYFISTRAKEPRAGIGQRGPLEYIFICVDGRVPESDGITLEGFAALFESYGCNVAYNLDGGGSCTLYYDGAVVNHIQGGGQRPISDIVYIAPPGGTP